MGFKKLRGVDLPEEKQGLVRYICLNSDSQPKRTQDKIQRLCDDVGGAYSAALREVMCGRKSITAIIGLYPAEEDGAADRAHAHMPSGCAACPKTDCPSRKV